jgi:hypothetical protein
MSRWSFVVSAAVSILVASYPFSARAQGPISQPPILPSIAALSTTVPSSPTSASPVSPDVPPGTDLVSKLARLYDKLRAEYVTRTNAGGPRNPAPRDPARDRDATSLGVDHPRLSALGAALSGGGVACLGIPLVVKEAKKLPVRLGPMGAVGGGGLAIRGRW